jgi:SAM-dependent methyltransferase
VTEVDRYYNEFYRELARLDAAGNDYSKVAELLSEEVATGRRLRIVDVGCGYGSVSGALARSGHEVYGVEIGNDAVRALPAHGIRPIKADIGRSLPIADTTMDVVLLLDVLEHVFNPLWLLAEARRVLRDRGVVVITVPLYFDLVDRLRVLASGSILSYDNLVYGREVARRFRSYNYDHIRFFRPRDVDEMMQLSGFEVQKRTFAPIPAPGLVAPLRPAMRFLARQWPGLFAHAMKVRGRKP